MNRHAYSNNGGQSGYPLGGRPQFSIQPHKYDCRSLYVPAIMLIPPLDLLLGPSPPCDDVASSCCVSPFLHL